MATDLHRRPFWRPSVAPVRFIVGEQMCRSRSRCWVSNGRTRSDRVVDSVTVLVPPTSYVTRQNPTLRTVQIVVRPGLDQRDIDRLTASLAGVSWHEVHHAYGEASDVPALLLAIAVGTDEVRAPAWTELWVSVHHQGSDYEATVPSVAFIEAIAGSREHPDRVEALSFLRQVAIGDGDLADDVRTTVRPGVERFVAGWETEPELVQRALVWAATVYPDIAGRHLGLARLVPDSMRETWADVVARSGYPVLGEDDSADEAMDREDALERWALAGWPSS